MLEKNLWVLVFFYVNQLENNGMNRNKESAVYC